MAAGQNYDMLAVSTDDQKKPLSNIRSEHTTFETALPIQIDTRKAYTLAGIINIKISNAGNHFMLQAQ